MKADTGKDRLPPDDGVPGAEAGGCRHKPRVLFPYTEAGMGHIMPMKAVAQAFREKYGDRAEVVCSAFFTESGDESLERYEKMLARQVRAYNRCPPVGYLATLSCELFGTALSSFAAVRLTVPGAFRAGVRHMEELAPDVVFSTHWATNYYAEHQRKRPLTIMYCPDARLNSLFGYRSDLSMISMPGGYARAMKKKRYCAENFKMVSFPIRNEAFAIPGDKRLLRGQLGLPEDNFTVVLAEGGYGIGRMEAICRLLVKEHIPLTVIPMCGKNARLFDRLKALEPSPEVTFRPYGFTERILELEAASDLFCGKSGNIIAEATFFGLPSIITNYSTLIEQRIGEHYMRTVGCAVRQFSPRKTVEMIERFARDGAALEPYRKAARDCRGAFGAEAAADAIWEKIAEAFPGAGRDITGKKTPKE